VFPIGLNELMMVSGLCCIVVFLPLIAAIAIHRRENKRRRM